MKELKVNLEFKKLIPPLSEQEFKQLEQNCLNDGIRDAIVTWQGFIIDGHNRYEISQRYNLPFDIIEKEFESEDQVKVWMIDNQKGRRNLTDGWIWELAQERKKLLHEKGEHKYKLTAGRPKKSLSNVDNDLSKENHNTQKEISTELGWSTGKVAMADKVWRTAKPEVKEKIKSGEISINQAYNEIKKEEKTIKLAQKKQEYIEASKGELKMTPLIHHEDAVSFLKSYDDNYIDLLITDPPYSTDVDNIYKFTNEWLSVALQKIKHTGRAYICSGAYPNEMQAYLNVLLTQDKFIVDNPLIWTYRNTLGVTPKTKYNLNYQIIWHLYTKDSPELDTSITNEMFSVQDINAPDGRLGNRLHTWQKPDELANRLIRHGSKKGDLVVDCFACTGTFLIAAARHGRKAKGCDIDVDNLEIAKSRGCIIIGM